MKREKNLKNIIGHIICMLENNYLNDITTPETFESWCEDGDIFETEDEKYLYEKLLEPTEKLLNIINEILENKEDMGNEKSENT